MPAVRRTRDRKQDVDKTVKSLEVKLRGRPEGSKGRRRPRRSARGDHLRLRTATSAAIMTMNRTTTAADFISYAETLTAPIGGRSRSPPTIVRGYRKPAHDFKLRAALGRIAGRALPSSKT